MHTLFPPASTDVEELLAIHTSAHLDIGCGDGLAALRLARSRPDLLVVGTDICLDNLARQSRKAPANLVFLQADATQPPPAFCAKFDSVSIVLPFGSLLRGMLDENESVIDHILSPLKPDGIVDVLVNESAVQAIMGGSCTLPRALDGLTRRLALPKVRQRSHVDLREWSSSWAKRIGFGKPSTSWHITGKLHKPGAPAPGPMVRSARPSSRSWYCGLHR